MKSYLQADCADFSSSCIPCEEYTYLGKDWKLDTKNVNGHCSMLYLVVLIVMIPLSFNKIVLSAITCRYTGHIRSKHSDTEKDKDSKPNKENNISARLEPLGYCMSLWPKHHWLNIFCQLQGLSVLCKGWACLKIRVHSVCPTFGKAMLCAVEHIMADGLSPNGKELNVVTDNVKDFLAAII